MVKKWKLEKKPSKIFPDRGILFLDSSLEEAKKLKRNFKGILGVVFKTARADFPWALYVYGASDNILKLIEQEIGVLSAGGKVAEKRKEAVKEKPVGERVQKDEFPKPPPFAVPEKKKPEEPEPPQEKPPSKKQEFPAAEKKKSQTKPPASAQSPEERPSSGKGKEEIKIEKFEKPKEEKIKTVVAPVEHFEKLTPDSAAEAPPSKPLIERFGTAVSSSENGKERAEEKAAPPKKPAPRPGSQSIKIVYFSPSSKKDLINQAKSSIETIIAEKNINFTFETVANIIYEKDEPRQDIIARLASNEFDFVIAIAPDENGENILRELKRKGYIPKVITEDNIDKKFRYLNLITDIVLSPRK